MMQLPKFLPKLCVAQNRGVLEIEEVPEKERKKQKVWQCSCRNCWGEKREKKKLKQWSCQNCRREGKRKMTKFSYKIGYNLRLQTYSISFYWR